MSDIPITTPTHLPFFLPGPDGNDPLLVAVIVILSVVFVSAGALYFKIHSLPEHMGEKQNSAQLQLISILVLLALFTHNNAFWVLALLIAVVRVPDFLTPLESIAESLRNPPRATPGDEIDRTPQPETEVADNDRNVGPNEQTASNMTSQSVLSKREEK